MKPIKKAISLIFKNPQNKALTVKRSSNKDTFPNFWSLPSAYVKEGEAIQETARRIASEKLGLDSVIIKDIPIGETSVDRGDYILEMSDFEVSSQRGEYHLNPNEYIDSRWVSPRELKELIDKEHNGEMGECTRVFLRAYGLIE